MTVEDLSHLQPPFQEAARLPNAERIYWLRQERWIQYPRAERILERLIETMAPHWRHAPRSAYDDASWLGFRLAELLPLDPSEQQRMLELTDPLLRLAELRDILPRFQKP